MSVKSIRGQCACGEVTFQLTGDPIVNVACYCMGCRKAAAGPCTFVRLCLIRHPNDLAYSTLSCQRDPLRNWSLKLVRTIAPNGVTQTLPAATRRSRCFAKPAVPCCGMCVGQNEKRGLSQRQYWRWSMSQHFLTRPSMIWMFTDFHRSKATETK